MKTKLLYETNPYEKSFEAKIIKKTHEYIVLDQTLFFPTKGGQYHDEGTINGIKIKDVLEENQEIRHYLNTQTFNIGDKIYGLIDFEYRYDLMQNHTGEHILSGIIHDLKGYDNIGFHLSSEVTVDYNGYFTQEELDFIETQVNKVIYANKKVKAYYLEDKNAKNYRSKKEISEDLRIVEIEDIDVCACCAPHVKLTGEVGQFVIGKVIRMKKGTRLIAYFGEKARHYLKNNQITLEKIHHLLSSDNSTVISYIENLINQKKRLEKQVKDYQKEKLISELSQKDSPIYIFYEELDNALMKDIVNEIYDNYHKTIGLFIGYDNKGYRFLLKGDIKTLSDLLIEHKAKGKGSHLMYQGFIVKTKSEINEIIKNAGC